MIAVTCSRPRVSRCITICTSRTEMSANARLFARPDAAERLARTLIRFAEGRPAPSEETAAGGSH